MKTLILVRHAKAEPENELGDHMRALSSAGRQQAQLLGALITEQSEPVTRVLVSSALRTKETYRLIATTEGQWPSGTSLDAIYEAGPRDLIDLLHECEENDHCVMVVGHEPTISSLASMLHDSRDDIAQQVRLGVPTATACILDVPVAWDEIDRNTCQLRAVVRPNLVA